MDTISTQFFIFFIYSFSTIPLLFITKNCSVKSNLRFLKLKRIVLILSFIGLINFFLYRVIPQLMEISLFFYIDSS